MLVHGKLALVCELGQGDKLVLGLDGKLVLGLDGILVLGLGDKLVLELGDILVLGLRGKWGQVCGLEHVVLHILHKKHRQCIQHSDPQYT